MFNFLTNTFSSLYDTLTGKKKLNEQDINQTLEKVRDALLESDVPYALINDFCAAVRAKITNANLLASVKPGEQLLALIGEEVKTFLGPASSNPFTGKTPAIIMVLGLQGSGKTTSIAKMARLLQKTAEKNNKKASILLASVDFYRPAAVQQLEILAKQINASFYRAQSSDPVTAAQEIAAFFAKNRFDYLFLDTAGRMHIDNTMLQELRSLDTLVQPAYKILVLDAMTGQESLTVAQAFKDAVGFDGAVLSKMDSDTRGGVVFSFRYALKTPIFFVGQGEKVDDLTFFYPDRIASQLLGSGDMETLIEKAQEKIKDAEQKRLEDSFNKDRMSLQDFADQLAAMNKIGSLSKLMTYMPAGMGGKVSEKDLERGDKELKRSQAIISSMTPKERLNHTILNNSRKSRIARGAGVTPGDITALLQRFEQMQQYAKLLKKMGGFGQFFQR